MIFNTFCTFKCLFCADFNYYHPWRSCIFPVQVCISFALRHFSRTPKILTCNQTPSSFRIAYFSGTAIFVPFILGANVVSKLSALFFRQFSNFFLSFLLLFLNRIFMKVDQLEVDEHPHEGRRCPTARPFSL